MSTFKTISIFGPKDQLFVQNNQIFSPKDQIVGLNYPILKTISILDLIFGLKDQISGPNSQIVALKNLY